MFTGIIEDMARVASIHKEGSNQTFTFAWELANELKIDQSVAHNGVCLTVIHIDQEAKTYDLTAIGETLRRSNLGLLQVGDRVNLERCMKADGRFDGHIVQGHVDQTATVTKIEELNGSWKVYFAYDASTDNQTVEKGSVCVNGVSLTVVDSGPGTFSVAVIPYTWQHTNFHTLQVGSVVNLEFDIIGKYVQQLVGRQLAGLKLENS